MTIRAVAVLALLTGAPAVGQAANDAALDRTVLPIAEPHRAITHELDARNAKAPPRFEVKAPAGAPNVVIVLIDDLGFGATSAFGGPIGTPTLDQLAQGGLRYNNFHTTALCSPTRAALKSGRNHHTVNMGFITEMATAFPGATGQIPNSTAPLAETLRLNGYSTAAFGKWHETPAWEASVAGPFDRWPTHQGFDKFYGFLGGETNQWAPYLYDGVAQVELPDDPELPLHDRHDRQGRGLDQVPEGADARQAVVRLLRPGRDPRAAPRAEGVDRAVEGQVRPGLGQDPRGDAGAADRDGRRAARARSSRRSRPAIKDWHTLSADEKRLFTRQAEVFAAFVEYTDHEVGRMLDAFDDVGEGDNTLVFYIAGDNGTSGEGGQNGMFNEYTYFNGVQEKVEDMLKRIDQWGGPETYPHMAAGWAVALNAPFGWMKQVPSDFGGTRNGMVVSWPKGIKAKNGIRTQFSHVIDVAPTVLQAAGAAGAQGRQRHAAGADRGHQPRVLLRRRRGEGAPHHAVLRDRRQPRHLPRRLVRAHDPPRAVGAQAAPVARRQLRLGAVRRPLGLQPRQRPGCEESAEAGRAAGGVPARKPPSTTCCRWTIASSSGWMRASVGRPDLMGGRTSMTLAEGMTGMMEAVFINVKNRSKTITAEVDVPADGGNGTILAQGGRFGGWSLYVKDGVPAYDYNFLGLQHTSIVSSKPLAPGKATIRFDFAYDGGGPGKGGMGTLYVNGEKVAEGRIEHTQAGLFSADETADVGIDLGTPVVESIGAEAKSKFTGHIPKVTVEVRAPKPVAAK